MKHITIIRIAAIAVVVIVAIVFIIWLASAARKTEVGIDVDDRINITPQQIESIRAIGQWEFLSIADEVMVDTTRKGFFSDDHLVRIYYGTIRLGIDMQKTSPNWLKTSGDSIIVTLPRVDLLDRDFIDEARTRSFHENGRWSPADREALYQRARQKMLQHCMTPENLRSARQNGEEQFRRMMRSMGFEHVSIHWTP